MQNEVMVGCVGLEQNIKLLNRLVVEGERRVGIYAECGKRASFMKMGTDTHRQQTKHTHTTQTETELERERGGKRREREELKRHLKLALVCRPEGGRGIDFDK